MTKLQPESTVLVTWVVLESMCCVPGAHWGRDVGAEELGHSVTQLCCRGRGDRSGSLCLLGVSASLLGQQVASSMSLFKVTLSFCGI